MAADHALRRELSRRIRDDLIRLGIVAAGPAVRIADGAAASAGDLIVCTRNDHTVEAGEPGRTLANGDLLRIEAVTPAGLIVRRALDADPATGQRRWTDRTFLYQDFGDAELGYAVTDHVAQGRTVTAGLAVITGTEDRQHAYVALSRGTDTNMAYVFTVSPKLADLVPGPRPAPELARYDRITADRDGQPAAAAAETRDALAVLADVLDRDGQQSSASQTRQQALANADHLAILHAIWTDRDHPGPRAALPGPAHGQPAAGAPARARPPGPMAVADPARRGAGRPGRRAGPGRRDRRAGPGRGPRPGRRHRRPDPVPDRHLVPAPAGPWSAQVPAIADPERRAYVTEIAALMDARKDRIGEHAAEHALPWAVNALGPVPDDPLDRLDWQRRAASIGAWRELSGHRDPADPIGAEPVAAAPDLRAAWHEALAALGPADGPDVRGMPDGRLLHLRDTYPIETAWAPPWVGDELRQVRAAAWDARLAGLRAAAEAAAAADRGDHRDRRPPAGTRRQLPGPARGLPAARDRLRRDHGRPRRLGRRHPRPAPPGRRRRRRTPPPPPRPALPPAPLRRTRTRHRSPARRAHPRPRGSRPARWASGSTTWPPRTARSPSGSPTGRA